MIPDLEGKMVHQIGYCVVNWPAAERALADMFELIHESGGTVIQADLPRAVSQASREDFGLGLA
ncbi:MAG TPA: hypothetical protein VEX35_01330 [Allosphingosinicella sp.]|nr:hypothetical protein [Allosphingosinicella sp.]